ncbi:hypothetical protein [Vibrio vulnificus]|nr:hypothetical protein [Vibrio vulnificus]
MMITVQNIEDAKCICEDSTKATFKIVDRGILIDNNKSEGHILVRNIESGEHQLFSTPFMKYGFTFYRDTTPDDIIEKYLKIPGDEDERLIEVSNELCDLFGVDRGCGDDYIYIDATENKFDLEDEKTTKDITLFESDKFIVLDGEPFGFDEYLIADKGKISYKK